MEGHRALQARHINYAAVITWKCFPYHWFVVHVSIDHRGRLLVRLVMWAFEYLFAVNLKILPTNCIVADFSRLNAHVTSL